MIKLLTMKEIDIGWLKKIQSVVDKLDRMNSKIPNEQRCDKSKFINRYFRFLKDKYFKIKIKDEVYFIFFSSGTVTDCHNKNLIPYKTYGIEFYLGYSDREYEFKFYNEKLKYMNIKLHWNDIIKIKYKEISSEEYWKIVKMFKFEEKLELI